jgi:hypothetical protein
MYRAWRAIEKNSVGDVLVGVGELVKVAMRADTYSLFLLNGDRLEAALNEGWAADDARAREFAGSSALLDAVVRERRFLLVVRPDDAEVLGGEGLLAGPLVNPDTREVIGMLKIESLRFLDLHMTTAHNFRVLCEWIGAAVARAQRVEDLRREVKDVGIARRLEAKLAHELGIDGLGERVGDRAAVPARESPCGMLD